MLIELGIIYGLVLPLLIYGYIEQRKGKERFIRVDFYQNGQTITRKVKMGFS